ncbi:MAG: hypothetical protein JST82_04985 [Bacteroidetes bacterium]|nr:hypothetical protein [Bacteroidota bacterium]
MKTAPFSFSEANTIAETFKHLSGKFFTVEDKEYGVWMIVAFPFGGNMILATRLFELLNGKIDANSFRAFLTSNDSDEYDIALLGITISDEDETKRDSYVIPIQVISTALGLELGFNFVFS